MAEKKKDDKKKKDGPIRRFKRGAKNIAKEVREDVDKVSKDIKKGKMPRIFKEKKTVKSPVKSYARNLTGRGGDPVSKGVKATTPAQKRAKKLAEKMTGKTPEKKKTGGKVTKKRTRKK